MTTPDDVTHPALDPHPDAVESRRWMAASDPALDPTPGETPVSVINAMFMTKAELAVALAAERERREQAERNERATQDLWREQLALSVRYRAAIEAFRDGGGGPTLYRAMLAALTDPQVPQAAPESGTEGERATPDLGDGA